MAVYNYEFGGKGLDFEALINGAANQFGWRLIIGTTDAPLK
jgi:hypothetical protein